MKDFGLIMVVVDRLSKYASFSPAPHACTAEVAADLFFKNVLKYWGIPADVVSDRDARFTGRFWTSLFELMGTKLNFSTTNHPQTDGQTERVNGLLEKYLRHLIRLALRKIGRGSPSVPRSTCRTSSSVGGTGFRFSRGSSEGLFSQVMISCHSSSPHYHASRVRSIPCRDERA